MDALEINHGRLASSIFALKAAVLRWRRRLLEFGKRPAKLTRECSDNYNVLLAQNTSPLWDMVDPREFALTAGKVQNLRVAAAALDGTLIPAGSVFSFWRQLGKLTRSKGYVQGRELRAGCLVPAIGGGICQLTNALHDVALNASFTIVERHAHSRRLPNSLTRLGRDATVFWNYVDLRFKAAQDTILKISLGQDALCVRFYAREPQKLTEGFTPRLVSNPPEDLVNSCDTCDNGACRRVILNGENGKKQGRTAWLIDEYWPEYNSFMQKNATDSAATILMPLNGQRWHKPNYSWSQPAGTKPKTFTALTLRWAWRLRSLAQQGPARQAALLARDKALAQAYAKKISPDVTHCVVMQNLLPHLWRTGALGGRTFDVLMTRLPFHELHRMLDDAAQTNPESTTLSDFRITQDLADDEAKALAQARRIVTPHRGIAALFPDNACLLDWHLPDVSVFNKVIPGNKIIFPAVTAGRKGAHLVRELARDSKWQLVCVGANIEGSDFWQGLPVTRRSWQENWWEGARVIVLPAYLEFKPRALLRAIALGIPVIATAACGISASENVKIVAKDDIAALRHAVNSL